MSLLRKYSGPFNTVIQNRLGVWKKLKDKKMAQSREEEKISVSIKGRQGSDTVIKGVTKPYDILKELQIEDMSKYVAVKVNGKLGDLVTPLEQDSELDFLTFDDDEGKKTFWHSSAHVLGEAMELHYGGNLAIGPAIEEGFFYDMQMPEHHTIKPDDFPAIKKIIKKILKSKKAFERMEITKEEAKELFQYNKYKLEIIDDKVPDGSNCIVYKCGSFIDLCGGPHIPNTGYIKAMEITKNSASFWKGDTTKDSLNRLYGISFPSNDLFENWKIFQEQAEARDHRKIGKEQKLFFFDKVSPGCSFFLPHGARIYNKLMNLMREKYIKWGFEEVITPSVYKEDLWKISGHWENYHENMFIWKDPHHHTTYSLKPMNCPAHCLMFKFENRSYKDLPIRFADFGVLHRSEHKDTYNGIKRVSKFQQDDAHIFCTEDQIPSEIHGCLRFLSEVYEIFGFSFTFELATRPDKFIGDIDTWNRAEDALKKELDSFSNSTWKLKEGDGAFYGPKIDVYILDALHRKNQCATIQLDFQLPKRFELEYSSPEDKLKTPVIIHRAIYGSLERFFAMIIENTAGKWPLWISPRQIMVLPLTSDCDEYAKQVQDRAIAEGYFADVDLSTTTLNKKIRIAQQSQYNYMLVVGKEEMENGTISIRKRDSQSAESSTMEEFLGRINIERDNYI